MQRFSMKPFLSGSLHGQTAAILLVPASHKADYYINSGLRQPEVLFPISLSYLFWAVL